MLLNLLVHINTNISEVGFTWVLLSTIDHLLQNGLSSLSRSTFGGQPE